MKYSTLTTAALCVALGARALSGCAAEESTPGMETAANNNAGNVTGTPTSNTATSTTSASTFGPTTVTSTSAGTVTTTTATVTTATVTTATVTSGTTTGAATTGAVTTAASATTGGGTTGGNTCTGTATTTPVALTPEDGFVSCSSNTVGVQGYFYSFGDGTSTITASEDVGMGATVCATGEATTADEEFTLYGAGVGLNLADEEVYDAMAMGISGVSFTISGTLPENFRFQVTEPGDKGFCTDVTTASQTVAFADLDSTCWDPSGDPPDASNLIAIQWVVTTVADGPQAFDFCIEDIQLIP